MKISTKVSKIQVSYSDNDVRKVQCFCGKFCDRSIVPHLKKEHSQEWEKWCLDFVRLRNKGWSYRRIMWKYRAIFSWTVIECEIKRMVEQKKAFLKIRKKRKIEKWEPSDFQLESTTVWSFPKRGNWAVHQSDYRGNWPPQLPRNLILRYTRKGDVVLDPFVGGGTSLIEAYLLNRRSIGIDINPIAIKTSKERIKELETKSKKIPNIHLINKYRPIVKLGDVKESVKITSMLGFYKGSIDLICTHPPYLDALRYTENVHGDLSHITNVKTFCDEIQKFARAAYILLKRKGRCTVLIGDVRKKGRVIPLGFEVMKRFLQENFVLEEIVIKLQHQDESTEFYYRKNMRNYLLAHEYIFIFEKVKKQ